MTPKYASYLHTIFVVSPTRSFIFGLLQTCNFPGSWSIVVPIPSPVVPQLSSTCPFRKWVTGKAPHFPARGFFNECYNGIGETRLYYGFFIYFSKELQHTHVCYLKENSKGSSQIGTTTTTVTYNNNGNNVQFSTVYNISKK